MGVDVMGPPRGSKIVTTTRPANTQASHDAADRHAVDETVAEMARFLHEDELQETRRETIRRLATVSARELPSPVTHDDPPDAAGTPTLPSLASWLARLFQAEHHAVVDDPAGVWRPSDRPVAALGLLLDPWTDIETWVARERLDALLVHRPWDLPVERLGDVGALAYHLAFDERLALGFNPWLAEALEMATPELLGRKQGRPIGMIGDVPERAWEAFRDGLARELGGPDRAIDGDARTVGRVAVVGAMTEALVREAAARGADAYVTGQLRAPARTAVEETGVAVVAVGHRRSEIWGMRTLARLLRARWPRLRVVLAPGLAAG